MSTRSRTMFLILAAVVAAVIISGLILRGLILADLEPFLKNSPADKADLLINRIGNLILLWSFLIALSAAVPAFLILRMSRAGDKHTPAASRASIQEPEPETLPHNEKKKPEQPATTGTQSSMPDISIRIQEETEETIPDEQDDRIHVDDPDRLKKIIQGLEELANAQALGRALQKQQLELALHLNDAVERTRAAVPDKEIQFNLECENGLTMNADPDCLAKIILHLMDNAAKAVKEKGSVTLSAAAHNGHVTIAVRDTGAGIKRKDLPHIFERFYRASGSGIGLGLTIVRELVDACGGRIEVETERGKGSQVRVRIPHR